MFGLAMCLGFLLNKWETVFEREVAIDAVLHPAVLFFLACNMFLYFMASCSSAVVFSYNLMSWLQGLPFYRTCGFYLL